MIRSIAIAATFSVLGVHAQLCNLTENPMPDGQDFSLMGGVLREGGGSLTLTLFNTLLGPFTTRWAADGAVLWNRNLTHMDPNNWLHAENIASTAGGGALLSGRFAPNQHAYENLYAAELDANGVPLWARIYMLDSVMVMGPRPAALIPLADGGSLYPIWTTQGLSLSKLNAEAIPVWTRRYRTGLGWHSGTQVYPQANGDITLVNLKAASTSIIRLDASGNVLWKRAYPNIGYAVGQTENGDILVASDDGGSFWYLARINIDGDLLWRRSYPYQHLDAFFDGGVRELGNGHLLLFGTDVLIETDADGAYLDQWSVGGTGLQSELLAARRPHGDTLVIAGDRFSGESVWTGMLTASSPDDLACASDPEVGSSNLLATPGGISDDTLYVVQDSLKTWTMNISLSQSALVLDPMAYANMGRARPGFRHSAYGVINNPSILTTGPVTATMTFAPNLVFEGADPEPTSVVGTTITWQLPALSPNGLRILTAEFTTPPDPFLIGTALSHTFSFTQDSTESTVVNNTSTVERIIVGAYDPNIKEVIPGPYYLIASDSILHYTIHFQNTGNAEATHVVVRDTLPTSVDTRTFQLEAMSHPCTWSLTGDGQLTFTFSNIDLPDSTSNEAASHGLVSFRIKPILPLTLGQEITNRADIFFDFNPPIRTPDATVVVSDATNMAKGSASVQLHVFPVPVKDQLNVELPLDYVPQLAWAVGVDGRRMPLAVPTRNEGLLRLNVANLAPAVYVLTLMDRSGIRHQARFTKE